MLYEVFVYLYLLVSVWSVFIEIQSLWTTWTLRSSIGKKIDYWSADYTTYICWNMIDVKQINWNLYESNR